MRRTAPDGALRPFVRARYDAAQTHPDNRKHWALADGLSANAANSGPIRRTLRNRSRYEAANNSYAAGIAQTIANDTVGTGPRIQFLSGDEKADDQVELRFAEWAREVDLARKLQTMATAQVVDGEAFALLVTNPRLRSQVKLDLLLVEAEQVASPEDLLATQPVDGIELDRLGNPVAYSFLREHPGDARLVAPALYDQYTAERVLHYFRASRPGQARGIPEFTPALELFAQLRRFTLATLTAAETSANLAGVLQSDAMPDGGPAPATPFEEIEIARGQLMTLPGGWKIGQVKAEHPTTVYGDFKRALIAEIARCLDLPYAIAACDASQSNYSSARFDGIRNGRTTGLRRDRLVRAVLDPLFGAWLGEAARISGFLPQSFRSTAPVPHTWHFDGLDHVDPEKEAKAQELRLRLGLTTYAAEAAAENRDWRDLMRQRALEQRFAKEQGISLPTTQPSPQSPAPVSEDKDGDQE